MMKKPIIIVSLLLICTLMFSSMPLFFGNYASASTGVANFLPNIFYGPSQNGFDTANEQTLSLNIAKAITSELASYNSPYGCYYSYESTCTVSSYYSILNTLKTYNDKEVVFSKGHRGLPYWNATPPNTVHRALIANDGKNFVDYNITDPSHVDIYSLTSSKNVVTFIWHCQTASDYPGNGLLPYDTYGYVSMPYIWTHNPSMLKYSTSSGSSQVYLGWVDRAGYTITWPNGTTTNTGPGTTYPTIGSPQYEWKINPTYNYGHVAYLFWHNMCNGDTTNDALNTLSKTVYGSSVNFRSSDLNDWLIVYGNMNLGLP